MGTVNTTVHTTAKEITPQNPDYVNEYWNWDINRIKKMETYKASAGLENTLKEKDYDIIWINSPDGSFYTGNGATAYAQKIDISPDGKKYRYTTMAWGGTVRLGMSITPKSYEGLDEGLILDGTAEALGRATENRILETLKNLVPDDIQIGASINLPNIASANLSLAWRDIMGNSKIGAPARIEIKEGNLDTLCLTSEGTTYKPPTKKYKKPTPVQQILGMQEEKNATMISEKLDNIAEAIGKGANLTASGIAKVRTALGDQNNGMLPIAKDIAEALEDIADNMETEGGTDTPQNNSNIILADETKEFLNTIFKHSNKSISEHIYNIGDTFKTTNNIEQDRKKIADLFYYKNSTTEQSITQALTTIANTATDVVYLQNQE